jgi:hypothetical protein
MLCTLEVFAISPAAPRSLPRPPRCHCAQHSYNAMQLPPFRVVVSWYFRKWLLHVVFLQPEILPPSDLILESNLTICHPPLPESTTAPPIPPSFTTPYPTHLICPQVRWNHIPRGPNKHIVHPSGRVCFSGYTTHGHRTLGFRHSKLPAGSFHFEASSPCFWPEL